MDELIENRRGIRSKVQRSGTYAITKVRVEHKCSI